MTKLLHVFTLLLIGTIAASATTIKGKVFDKQTGEALVGATVVLEETGKSTTTGLDGSFEIKDVTAGDVKIHIRFINYQEITSNLSVPEADNQMLKFYMEMSTGELDTVVVSAHTSRATDEAARRIEQRATQIMNIISGRAIEISPDLTVANVMQRVSGVSLERNSNGDGQYAILRGMDKRYNYTLVNGVKIPSPDDKYRYVPLDIFPSDLLERLEVYKTLTPNMEGDAIGGAVNMVMKTAPDHLQVDANISTGYSQLFLDRDFKSYNAAATNNKSPYEINGRSYNATQKDFPNNTLDYREKKPAPNFIGSLSVGDRFLGGKLGVILAASYQRTYRGSNSTFYSSSVAGTDKYAVITGKSYREYSEQQRRLGLHGNVDYVFDKDNKISLYNLYVDFRNQQIRDAVGTTYNGVYDPENGNAELTYVTRSRLTKQQIYNSTLNGDHHLFDQKLKLHWSAVFSSARNEVPDNTIISLDGVEVNFIQKRTSLVNKSPVQRRWERNTDMDKAGYLDLTYTILNTDRHLDAMIGGMYRDKQRSSFFNNYNLAPIAADAHNQYGVDFENYTDLRLVVSNPTGAVANALTYDASEKIGAAYGMLKYNFSHLELIGGARVEHTNQGYNLLFPAGEKAPKGSQVYTDLLPSLTLKYHLNPKAQLHASYYKALNRPGFYEIVPSKVVNEEYEERGNPNLKRALADNYDLRYELFPGASEQLLVGLFYKHIKDPIEYTFQPDAVRGQDIYYTPGNFGTANNYGAEIDYIKYFNKIGFKVNYTYTHSRITTPKTSRIVNETTGDTEPILVDQTRPLYGQSAHIANLILLFKDTKTGWDIQVAGGFTGPRIHTVSQFYDNDLWQKGFVQMDASVEKTFKNKFTVFAKANNLLNTPMKLFIKGTNPENDKIKEQLVEDGKTLIRNDYYGQNYLIGLRFKLN